MANIAIEKLEELLEKKRNLISDIDDNIESNKTAIFEANIRKDNANIEINQIENAILLLNKNK